MSPKVRRVVALVTKEFRQMVRDPSSIAIGVVLPVMLILLFGYGLSLDVRNAPIAVVDEDGSPDTRAVIAAFQLATATGVQTAIDQVTQTLSRRHAIQPGEVPDFAVRNLSEIADAAKGSSHVMSLLLVVVASISLLVGGIGIMNILLVSVTERTREIGLRMAIGARRIHVLLQFLAEAVFLSVTGGAAGIIAGVVTSKLISAVAGWPTVVLPASIAVGFLFSVAVGVFFGYYPARKASHFDPIEALHFE